MKKKALNLLIALTSVAFIFAIALYIFASLYYCSGYSFGTVVNSIYCTGMSPEEVNVRLKENFKQDKLVFTSDYFSMESIDLSEIDFSVDYLESLDYLFYNQNPWEWPLNLFKDYGETDILPVINFSEDKLKAAVDKLDFSEYYSVDKDISIEIRDSIETGLYLYDETCPYLDSDDILALSIKALSDDYTVKIDDTYFRDRQITKEAKEVYDTWSEVADFITPRLTYDFGAEKLLIDSTVLSSFLIRDENGRFLKDDAGAFLLNQDKMVKYIDSLCGLYNTYKKPRDYVTYRGESKHIELSTYGTEINLKEEEKYFVDAIKNKLNEEHVPVYKHTAFARGLNDIGNTFIEVDMTNQVLLYIKDGELVMECDIVSGKPVPGRETPEIVASILRKNRNVNLRGADYVSFVRFWMPFYGGDGLHDASWQKEFGGERYIKYGSHGCINMRYDDVSALYEQVEVGTPIIVYK